VQSLPALPLPLSIYIFNLSRRHVGEREPELELGVASVMPDVPDVPDRAVSRPTRASVHERCRLSFSPPTPIYSLRMPPCYSTFVTNSRRSPVFSESSSLALRLLLVTRRQVPARLRYLPRMFLLLLCSCLTLALPYQAPEA
jgi:hypothetical protein